MCVANALAGMPDDHRRAPPSTGPERASRVTEFRIEQWRAWAPGLDSMDDWCAWHQTPSRLPDSGAQPDVGFLPAMQRRRLSRLARMAFHVAWPLAEAQGPMPMVFACRHGETPRTLAILTDQETRKRPEHDARTRNDEKKFPEVRDVISEDIESAEKIFCRIPEIIGERIEEGKRDKRGADAIEYA